MNLILNELKIFSKENWWIFVLLIIAMIVVYITWNWNIIEILLLFIANFAWNLFIMIMQKNYTIWNNKAWSLYYTFSFAIFWTVWLYWLLYLWQTQYIIWQIAYFLAWLKPFIYYNFNKDIKFLNEKSFIILNLLLFSIFIYYFDYKTYSVIQAIWFCLITTWLVSIIDTNRYWLNVVWIWLLTLWSLLWVIVSFNLWSMDWIALWYFTLTWTVFIYYLKLIKKYI